MIGIFALGALSVHGYRAVRTAWRRSNPTSSEISRKLACFADAVGVIVHSNIRGFGHFYGETASDSWVVIPFARRLPQLAAREVARKLGFANHDLFVLIRPPDRANSITGCCMHG
jgi:hypothetical protein